jgi:aminoglycoside phosphotransferase (APT) family kinase protein
VRQPADDRALYYRQLRTTVATVFAPELTGAAARDAVGLVDRILAEFIVEEEWAPALSEEFGTELAALLGEPAPQTVTEGARVTPERFVALRRQAADVVATSAGSVDPAVRERCRQLVDVERRFLERVDELRRAVLDEALAADAAVEAGECSMSSDEVAVVLRRSLPGSGGLRVTRLDVVPGGRSKETIVVSLTGTTELPPEVIVRKDRPIGILPTRAADEYAVLAAVHAHGGVPVPRPYLADKVEDGREGGREGESGRSTLLVMERVPGRRAGEYFPDLEAPPAPHRVALGSQLAAALAHLHAIPLDDLEGTGLDLDAEVSASSLTAAVEGMAARLGELSGPPVAAFGLARQWLLDHVGDVVPAGRLCLLQGDVGLHNMLVDGDRLTALVDWEAATVGPPAREMAAAWPAATALMDWPNFVATYRAAGGPEQATEPRAVTYYRVFFALGACMSSRTGGHLFRTGAKRDLVTAHSGLDAHFRAQRNLVRALTDAAALDDG